MNQQTTPNQTNNQPTSQQSNQSSTRNKLTQDKPAATSNKTKQPAHCIVCDVPHWWDQCPKSPDDRFEWFVINDWCIWCASPKHSWAQYPSKFKCIHCWDPKEPRKGTNHYPLLCHKKFGKPTKTWKKSQPQIKNKNIQHMSNNTNSNNSNQPIPYEILYQQYLVFQAASQQSNSIQLSNQQSTHQDVPIPSMLTSQPNITTPAMAITAQHIQSASYPPIANYSFSGTQQSQETTKFKVDWSQTTTGDSINIHKKWLGSYTVHNLNSDNHQHEIPEGILFETKTGNNFQ